MKEFSGIRVRKVAFEILSQYEKSGTFLHVLFENHIHNMESRDNRLVRQICYEVVRWKNILDYNIFHYLKNKKISTSLLICLRLTVAQLILLKRIPPYAAVNTGVELVKSMEGRGAASLANALLMGIAKKGKLLPEKTSPEYLSIIHSHPPALIRKIEKEVGPKKLPQILTANNAGQNHWVRVNTLKLQDTQGITLLEELQPERNFHPKFPYLQIKSGYQQILESSAFKEGLISIQDPASYYVAKLIQYKQDMQLLDLCSAPGGKAALISEMYQVNRPIICNDIAPKRIAKIKDLRIRMGHNNLKGLVMDIQHPALKTKFDIILIDAPCSNLGVIARRPEIKWRYSEDDLSDICHLQDKLLEQADKLLNKNGALVYSTCSPYQDETFTRVQKFLQTHKNYRLDDAAQYVSARYVVEGCLRLYPGDTEFDGFFGARLIKSND